jgi:peroxiredoxin
VLIAGGKAPDFTLSSVKGDKLSLSEVLNHGQHALLIFLRYLG